MKYDAQNRTLTLEPKDCTTCEYGAGERGQYTGRKTCPACNGTGDGPRGGKGRCRTCYSSKTTHDFDNPIVCPSCGGQWQHAQMENFCDRAPAESALSMPIVIARMDRPNTWNENYLALGCLWSCTDYGEMRKRSDDDAVAFLREKLAEDRTQATKIVKPYERADEVATLHDLIVLVITTDGYSVRAMSDVTLATGTEIYENTVGQVG